MSQDRVAIFEKIQTEARRLFTRKNQDYGDAFANYGAIGVLVRMGDKISRLQSITNRQISLVNTESLRDTLLDLHNYSAMAIMLLDEKQSLHNTLPSPVTTSPQISFGYDSQLEPTQLFNKIDNNNNNNRDIDLGSVLIEDLDN